MESIEKLRKMDDEMLVPLGNGQYVPDHSHNDIADEIEREIAERYMELPKDADGVSIHVGDELCGYGRLNGGVTVSAVTGWGGVIVTDKGMTCNPAKNGLLWDGQVCRHVKPRTLEDVLRDCCNEWNKHLSSGWEAGVYAKYAAEIRELLEVSE